MDTLRSSFVKKAIVFMILFTVFSICTSFVINGDIKVFDDAVRSVFYGIRSDALSSVVIPFTYMGNWQVITGLCTILILIKNTRKDIGMVTAFSALSSDLLNKVVKSLVMRPRPDKALHLVTQGGYSFPSGHAMTGLVFYGMMIYCLRKRLLKKGASESDIKKARIITCVLSALIVIIGLSRIYVGVHYPSDVLAGWCLGSMYIIFLISIEKVIRLHQD